MSRSVQTQKYPVEMFRVVHRCQEVMRHKRYPAEMSTVVRRCQEVFRHRGIQLRCSELFVGVKKCSDTEIFS